MHGSLSASIEADAPHFLHFPDPALWAWAAVGVDRQRGGQSAALLPASRSAPLRYGHADGRDDAQCCVGQGAGNRRAHDVPAVSGSGGDVCLASACADGFGQWVAGGAGAEPHCGRGSCYARTDSNAHPCRTRTSSRHAHLKTSPGTVPASKAEMTRTDGAREAAACIHAGVSAIRIMRLRKTFLLFRKKE